MSILILGYGWERLKHLQSSGEVVDMVIEEQDPDPGATSVASTTLNLTRHLLSKAAPSLCSGIRSGHTQLADLRRPRLDIRHMSARGGLQSFAAVRIEGRFERGRLKDWCRVTTRFDRCPKVFLSVVVLAANVMLRL